MTKGDDNSMDEIGLDAETDARWSQASIFLSGLIINTREQGSAEYEQAVQNTILAMTMLPRDFYAKC